MNLEEFDSTEPVCKFGPGGDFIADWPARLKPADKDCKWISVLASTKGPQTQIRIVLPFLMTKDELEKLTSDVGEVTREMGDKYIGPSFKEILIDL